MDRAQCIIELNKIRESAISAHTKVRAKRISPEKKMKMLGSIERAMEALDFAVATLETLDGK